MSYNAIKNQFELRTDTFDKSAKWVTDEGLLNIHQELAEVSARDLILDACCGTGMVGQRLSQNVNMAIGLDISPHMLRRAKRKRLTFCVNGQIEQTPFLDNVFDVVVCRQAFHFLITKKAIKEIFRVTKPDNGRIIISQIVPFNREDSRWLYEIHRKKQPLLKNFLTEHEIKNLLKNIGCVDIVSRNYFVEECVDDWLLDTHFPQETRDSIKEMFLGAPKKYKRLHRTKVVDGKVFDTMRWLVVRGKKI